MSQDDAKWTDDEITHKKEDGIGPISAKVLRNPDSDLSLKIGRKKRKYSSIRPDLYGSSNISK